MVRIISPGVGAKYTNTCPYCMCIYEYDASDLIYTWDLSSVTTPYIMCPYCRKRNNIYACIPYNVDSPFNPDISKVTCDFSTNEKSCSCKHCKESEGNNDE